MNNSVHKGIIYKKEGPTLIGRGKKNCTQLKKMGEKKKLHGVIFTLLQNPSGAPLPPCFLGIG